MNYSGHKVTYSYPKVTHSYLNVTYSYPRVTYSDPKVTQSDPTHLPLPPPTSHLAKIRPLVKCIETSGWVVGGGGGWVATNFNVSSRQGFKL